jgi:D-aspartate ligase
LTRYQASAVPVLVLGSRITALGVMRTLGRAGIPAYLVGREHDYSCWSRWHRALPQDRQGMPKPGNLDAWLASTPLDRAVLLPCADDWVFEVASLSPQLLTRFPSSIAEASSILCLLDKGRFAELVARCGIAHPPTILIDSPEQLDRLNGIDFARTFLKPRNSLEFSARYGVKAFQLNNHEEAVRVAGDALSHGIHLMLQEYIPGPPTEHYFIDGFVDRNGAVPAWLARRRVRMHPADFGNSSFHVSIPREDVRPAFDALNNLLRSVNYRGIFSAEFKHDFRDGQFKILEVNVRPWWYVEFAARSGVDVCSLAYRDALGLPAEPIHSYQVGRRCVTFELDFKAFLQLRQQKQIRSWQWLRSWLGADHPVFSWTDPAPVLRMLLSIISNKLAASNGRRECDSLLFNKSDLAESRTPDAGESLIRRDPRKPS